jgi:hypothetical protein
MGVIAGALQMGRKKSSGFRAYSAILSSAFVLRIVGCVGILPVLI